MFCQNLFFTNFMHFTDLHNVSIYDCTVKSIYFQFVVCRILGMIYYLVLYFFVHSQAF